LRGKGDKKRQGAREQKEGREKNLGRSEKKLEIEGKVGDTVDRKIRMRNN